MWSFLSGLWDSGLNWIGGLFSGLGNAIATGFNNLGSFLSRTFGGFFHDLTAFFSRIFGPLLDLVTGLIYLLGQAVDVVILVVQVILYLVQVLVSFATGLVRSLVALATFSPDQVAAVHNPYAAGTGIFFRVLAQGGGDVLAAVLGWAFWFGLAVAVMYLFARSGGEAE